MVTLNRPEMIITNGQAQPAMHKHTLTANKDTKTFKQGESAVVFIAKYTDGRYAIMDAHFKYPVLHYEVFTEKDLHDSFDEQSS